MDASIDDLDHSLIEKILTKLIKSFTRFIPLFLRQGDSLL
jgi:hypothetical protein